MLAIVSAELPLLVRVTAWAALVVFTCWFPNETEVGERLTPGVVPAPLKLAVCGLPAALSATLRVPLRAPAAVGVNVTLMVQVPLTARVDGLNGHVLVWPKSPLLVPVTLMLAIVSAELPLLVRVSAWAALVVFTCCSPSLPDALPILTPGVVPAPLKLAVCGLPAASSATLRVPLRAPAAVGVNVTLMVQVPLT